MGLRSAFTVRSDTKISQLPTCVIWKFNKNRSNRANLIQNDLVEDVNSIELIVFIFRMTLVIRHACLNSAAVVMM